MLNEYPWRIEIMLMVESKKANGSKNKKDWYGVDEMNQSDLTEYATKSFKTKELCEIDIRKAGDIADSLIGHTISVIDCSDVIHPNSYEGRVIGYKINCLEKTSV